MQANGGRTLFVNQSKKMTTNNTSDDAWYGAAKDELYDVYSDPSNVYHYDSAPHDGSAKYIGTRYQWVATFNTASEAEAYANELNSNRPELAD